MKTVLNIVRNVFGISIALISWIIPTKKVKRSVQQQQKFDKQTQHMELYQFLGCPFCIKTQRAIRKLNLSIISRNAQAKGIYRNILLAETGKVKVPCLKIHQDGETTWMFESSNIISYLNKRFG